MKKLVLILLVVLIGQFSQATTYYVAITGSDANPGTSIEPFRNIQYAASYPALTAGDVVIVRDGIYTNDVPNYQTQQVVVKLSKSGTAGAYITFKAENKGGAIIDGESFEDHFGIMATGLSYIKIEGFEIRHTIYSGIYLDQGSDYIEVRDCYIHNIGEICTDITNGLCPISLLDVNHILVERSILCNSGRLAPDEGCSSAEYYQWQDHGIYIDGSNYITVQNCIFYGIQGGWPLHFYSGGGSSSTGNNILNNTFAFGHRAQCFIILYETLSNTNIKNNVFYHGDDASYDISAAGNHGILINTDYTYSNVVISNNMTYRGSGLTTSGTVSGVTSYNNTNSTDPLMVNPATYDFSLQSSSPAVDAGANLGVATDFTNNPRTGTTDIGAYEYFTGTYFNFLLSRDIQKNNCGTGYLGLKTTYTVPANTYNSEISQIDADSKAQADIDLNGQSYANTNGYCLQISTIRSVVIGRKSTGSQ